MSGSNSKRIDETEQRTLREWSSRIERLNSIDSGLLEPRISSPYSKGALGYAGFYHYLTANNNKGSGSVKGSGSGMTNGQNLPNRPTNFERWIAVRKPGNEADQYRKHDDTPGYPIVDSAELKDIQRCFQAADEDGTGWLDCEGFKQFMSMRGAPITHLDARKLLKAIDSNSQRYISFDQVMYLVAHCGITTDHEIPITSDEFKRILTRMRHSSTEKDSTSDVWPKHDLPHPDHRRPQTVQSNPQHYEVWHERDLRPRKSRVIHTSFPMDHSRSFFEEMASEVQVKANEERLYKEYRREIQKYGSRRPDPPAEPEFEGPPGWKNMILHSQDPNYHVPPIVFKDLRKDWETKTRGGDQEEEGVKSNENGSGQGQGHKVGEYPPLHSACHLKIEGAPKGLPASAFCVPGRPHPFVVTQTDLQMQLDKIRKKSKAAEEASTATVEQQPSEPKTDLLFKALTKVKGSDSCVEVATF